MIIKNTEIFCEFSWKAIGFALFSILPMFYFFFEGGGMISVTLCNNNNNRNIDFL